MIQDFESDIELQRLLDKLHSTMKDVRSQINIIEATMSPCEKIEKKNYEDCINAVSTAEVEAIRFIKLNAELVEILASLRRQVYASHL